MTYSPGSTAGRWSAFIEPMTSRTRRFHLVKAEPARFERTKEGHTLTTGPQAYEVAFDFRPIPEGDFADEPTLKAVWTGDDDVTEFLQCVVDEAAKHGIVARDAPDREAEKTALRDHLEDMRRLVYRDKYVRLGVRVG